MFWRNGGVQKLQQKLGRETPSGFFHVSFFLQKVDSCCALQGRAPLPSPGAEMDGAEMDAVRAFGTEIQGGGRGPAA